MDELHRTGHFDRIKLLHCHNICRSADPMAALCAVIVGGRLNLDCRIFHDILYGAHSYVVLFFSVP